MAGMTIRTTSQIFTYYKQTLTFSAATAAQIADYQMDQMDCVRAMKLTPIMRITAFMIGFEWIDAENTIDYDAMVNAINRPYESICKNYFY